jgi:hypothetical protein
MNHTGFAKEIEPYSIIVYHIELRPVIRIVHEEVQMLVIDDRSSKVERYLTGNLALYAGAELERLVGMEDRNV